MHCLLLQLLLLSLWTQVCRCLHILDAETCSIPYITPLIFQRECDISDEFYHTELDIETPDGTPLEIVLPPPYITALSMRKGPAVWTHEPFCLESLEAENGYCVYTDARFGSGRGLSVIANPTMVREVYRIPLFGKRQGVELKSTFEGLSKFSRVRMHDGSGTYAVANASFTRGERVHSALPIILMQSTGNALLVEADQNLLLRVALSRASEEARSQYMSQYASIGPDPLVDRLEKNSFSTKVGQGDHMFIAALPESAVFNHDCRPNIVYHNQPDTLAHELYVVRDIAPGEEMTVSYMGPYDDSVTRAKRSMDQWGFKCKCALCSSSPAKRRESDLRLHEILVLVTQLNAPVDNREVSDEKDEYVKKALRMMELHELEGLWGSVGGAHMYVAMEYKQMGDNEKALKWAQKARQSLGLWSGTGHPYFLGMERLIKELNGGV